MVPTKNNKKIWWSKLKSIFTPKLGDYSRKKEVKEGDSLCEKLNVNDEYKEVLRTDSYMDIWSKVQVQLTGAPNTTTLDDDHDDDDEEHYSSSSISSSFSSHSSSPSSSNNPSTLPYYMNLSDLLLEPRQEAVIDIIKSSNLQTLLVDYFDASFEACNVCELLLRGIHKTKSNHRVIKRVIDLFEGEEDMQDESGHYNNHNPSSNFTNNNEQCHEMMLQDLTSFANSKNSLSSIINEEVNFSMIHEKYALLLRKLNARRRKTKRKEKFTRFSNKAASYGVVITYIVLAIAVLALATHSVVGLLGAPALLLPISMDIIKRVKSGKPLKASLLKHLGSQLDVAAKGVYIFINDFDTVGRLVTRLHDEVEHKRELAEMCVKNGKSHEVVRKAMKDIQMHEHGFQEQLEELEEHIYLCFLTINRSRRLVLQEILAPFNNA